MNSFFMDIEISSCGKATAVLVNGIKFYAYWNIIVAFEIEGKEYIAQNIWGSGCGVVLNSINRDKSVRIPHKKLLEFIKEL